jgi:hypothetical protein
LALTVKAPGLSESSVFDLAALPQPVSIVEYNRNM